MFKETKEGQTHYCEACEYEARRTEKTLVHTCGKKVDFFNQPLGNPEQLEKPVLDSTKIGKGHMFSKLSPTTKPEKWEMGA